MKKFFFTLVVLLTSLVSANAMSYEQARDQALFLTDKMAYELNLNEQQYEAAYEINLDYLMGVTTVDDVYAASWRQRNLDMQYIMLDWQYSAFCAATYFFRPLYWNAGCWHFGIYAHYPHRDYFYYSRPACYLSYRGGHSWRYNGGRSWYVERTVVYRGSSDMHRGMREVHNRIEDRSYRAGSVRGNSTGRYATEHRSVNGNRGGEMRNNSGAGYRGNGNGNATERRGNSFSGNRGNAGSAESRQTTPSYRENGASSYNRGNRENGVTSYSRGTRDNSSSSYSRGSSTRTTVDRTNTTTNRPSSFSGGSVTRSSSFSGGNRGAGSVSRGGGSSMSRGGGSSVSHGGGNVSHGGGFSGGGHGGRR